MEKKKEIKMEEYNVHDPICFDDCKRKLDTEITQAIYDFQETILYGGCCLIGIDIEMEEIKFGVRRIEAIIGVI